MAHNLILLSYHKENRYLRFKIKHINHKLYFIVDFTNGFVYCDNHQLSINPYRKKIISTCKERDWIFKGCDFKYINKILN